MEQLDIMEALKERHTVRTYLKKDIEKNVVEELISFIRRCNQESGLHMQLILNEPKAFDGMMAHYGKFSGVTNYIAIVGPRNRQEKCGYYGQKVVIKAQQLGLNTCWVGLTFDKIRNAFQIGKGEKLYIVIAIGYGAISGVPHRSKAKTEVTDADDNAPEWFWKGIEAALLAPTARHQQQFFISLDGNRVIAKAQKGFFSKLDLGIVKYQFELGAGKENFVWKESIH